MKTTRTTVMAVAMLTCVTLTAKEAGSNSWTYPVTLTLDEDTFVRCLIGQCAEIDDGFDGQIEGTDLGIIAISESGFAYIFFGDTWCPGDNDCSNDGWGAIDDPDAYLRIPMGSYPWLEYRDFVTNSSEPSGVSGYLMNDKYPVGFVSVYVDPTSCPE